MSAIGDPTHRGAWTIALIGILFLAGFPGSQCRVDPATGRIRILYIGDGWGPSPVPNLQSDPAFTVVSVPTSELHVGQGVLSFDVPMMKKFVRLYMPRTFEALLDNFEMIIISDANSALMENHHLEWMKDSVTDDGFGIVMVGGLESFGAPRAQPWTALEELFPVVMTSSIWSYRDLKVKPAVDHPFTRSLPWATIPYFHGANNVWLKEGAILLLRADETDIPPLSYWDIEQGRGVAHSMDWTPGGGTDVMRWEYYPDYVANVGYLATKNEIPQDAQLLHHLRTSFWSTRSRLTSVIDTMNFVEKFGASTQQIGTRLGDVRVMIKDAERLYVQQEYDASTQRIKEIDDLIIELQGQAMKLKDRALLWIYMIEWAATTGTALVAGFFLWTLMIRRRLYREVRTTRLV